MLPIWTICALFLALATWLLAKEHEFRFEEPDAQTVDLMAECNEDMATMSLHEHHPPFGSFVNVPIYLSSGADDKIATPEAHREVMKAMKLRFSQRYASRPTAVRMILIIRIRRKR